MADTAKFGAQPAGGFTCSVRKRTGGVLVSFNWNVPEAGKGVGVAEKLAANTGFAEGGVNDGTLISVELLRTLGAKLIAAGSSERFVKISTTTGGVMPRPVAGL